jgi:NAD-dependent dihydropyrimidine dehydrogenase PreA subunit
MPVVEIDLEKCKGCQTCVDVCPMQVFEKDGDKVKASKSDSCIGCRACEVQCPVQAIKIDD